MTDADGPGTELVPAEVVTVLPAATTSDRGFDYMRPIPSEYGGHVSVSESSAASGPHVWLWAKAPVNLNDRDGPTREVPIHLTAENAWRLARQLDYLVRNHYQGDATPEGPEGAA